MASATTRATKAFSSSRDAEHVADGPAQRQPHDPWPAGDGFSQSNPQWLHQQLMANPEYRLKFADRVQATFFNGGVFTPEAVRARLQSRAAEIEMAIIAESARWGDAKSSTPLTKSHWQSELNRILNSIPQRTDIVSISFGHGVAKMAPRRSSPRSTPRR